MASGDYLKVSTPETHEAELHRQAEELGLRVIDASVSFTKGCYTGQELVARIDSRGGNVPRHLRGLDIGGLVVTRTAESLEKIVGVVEAGLVDPMITARYPLADAASAIAAVEAGHAAGKVIIEP